MTDDKKHALTHADVSTRLKKHPLWMHKDKMLVRRFEFPTYQEEMEFVTQLGREAEKMDHHPSIIVDYKKATVKYSTHSAGGITDLDFKAAEIADSLVGESQQEKEGHS